MSTQDLSMETRAAKHLRRARVLIAVAAALSVWALLIGFVLTVL